MGVCLCAPAPPLKEADDRPLPQRQGKTIGGAGAVIMGNAKANAPILIWRGLKNLEALFCFRLTALDGGQTKKRGEASSFVPLSFPVLQ